MARAPRTEQLDQVDEIVVDQAVDRAWEARLKIPVCVNNDGKWEGEQEAWMKAFTRDSRRGQSGRREIRPLIDGPVVGFDSARSRVYRERASSPSSCMTTARLLNREAQSTCTGSELGQRSCASDLP